MIQRIRRIASHGLVLTVLMTSSVLADDLIERQAVSVALNGAADRVEGIASGSYSRSGDTEASDAFDELAAELAALLRAIASSSNRGEPLAATRDDFALATVLVERGRLLIHAGDLEVSGFDREALEQLLDTAASFYSSSGSAELGP